jgi:hypothetical protein
MSKLVKFRRYYPLPPSYEPWAEGKPYRFPTLKYKDYTVTEEEYEKIIKVDDMTTPTMERRIQARIQALEDLISELSASVRELQKWKTGLSNSKKPQQVTAKTKGAAK